MSKRLLSRFLGLFGSRTQVGVDKAGNRYFTRMEEVDGVAACTRYEEVMHIDQTVLLKQLEIGKVSKCRKEIKPSSRNRILGLA